MAGPGCSRALPEPPLRAANSSLCPGDAQGRLSGVSGMRSSSSTDGATSTTESSVQLGVAGARPGRWTVTVMPAGSGGRGRAGAAASGGPAGTAPRRLYWCCVPWQWPPNSEAALEKSQRWH